MQPQLRLAPQAISAYLQNLAARTCKHDAHAGRKRRVRSTSSAPRSSVTRLQTFRQRWFSGWFCKFFDFVANRLQAPVFSPGVLRRHREGATGRCEASRTKPLVVNDGLCHEVEKLARAALFAADATFDCCYPCQTFSTVAFGSPAQMFHVKHRTERNAGGWDPPLNRNRHDRSPPSSELSRADVGATATDRQNRAGAAEGVDFAGWGGLHGRAPGFGRSRGLGRWRICAAIKPVCDI